MKRPTLGIHTLLLVPCVSLLIGGGCGSPQQPQSSSTKATTGNSRASTAKEEMESQGTNSSGTNTDDIERQEPHSPAAKSKASPPTTKRDADVTTRPNRPQTVGPAEPHSSSRSAATSGILSGRVLLSGTPPQPRKITVTKNPETCGRAAGERQDVVVSGDGGLKDVVVEILGVESSEGFSWTHPDGGYVLRQKDCQFRPALIVMPAGEKLTVINDDPIGHNVNSGQWNEQQPGGGAPIIRPLSGNRPVRVGCNIHSWMESWVYLARSPFFALSDDQGRFRIENVPPGKYRVTFWHSSLRPTRQQVTIKAGQVDHHEVVFSSPVSN